MKKPKKGLTLKKIKKCFIEVLKEIGNVFQNIYQKFLQIPKYIRIIGIVWIVIIIIIMVLIQGTSNNNKMVSKYKEYEEIINTKAIEYAKKNSLYGTRDSKIVIDLEQLKQDGYITKVELEDSSCRGYSMVYYDDETDEYISKSYINCLDFKYKSEDYDAYKKK